MDGINSRVSENTTDVHENTEKVSNFHINQYRN